MFVRFPSIKLIPVSKKLIISSSLLLLLLLFSLFIPTFYSYSSLKTNLSMTNAPPNWNYLFGTDELGRNLLLRVAFGLRVSLFLGFSIGIIDLLLGLIIGTASVLLGGYVDLILMRICDVLQAIPYLLIVILLMVLLPQGLLPILLALTLTGWINIARIVRLQTIELKQKEFVLFALMTGARRIHIFRTHILIHLLGPLLTTTSLTIPQAIYTEAFLSFLGLGVRAPQASLGTMVADGIVSFRFFPWRFIFPALFLSGLILVFNLFSDALQEVFTKKMSHK